MKKEEFNITFDYDKDGDVLYITLGTGEPAYCEEVDDVVVIERGMFSNRIVGFQVLHLRDLNIREVNVSAFIQKALKKEEKAIDKDIRSRKEFIKRVPNKVKKSPDLRHIFQQIGTA